LCIFSRYERTWRTDLKRTVMVSGSQLTNASLNGSSCCLMAWSPGSCSRFLIRAKSGPRLRESFVQLTRVESEQIRSDRRSRLTRILRCVFPILTICLSRQCALGTDIFFPVLSCG
ncbi:hypothetical protein KCU67_g100, partial [Aureobasidium melanogenum]